MAIREDRSTLANATTLDQLPLLYRTPDEWAVMALGDPLSLLNDHAYLEKKAASNALELLNRWPERAPPEEWTLTLAAIASDEASHLLEGRRPRIERLVGCRMFFHLHAAHVQGEHLLPQPRNSLGGLNASDAAAVDI